MKKFIIIFLLICAGLISFGQFHERIYFNNLYNQNVTSSCRSVIEIDSTYLATGITIDSMTGYKTIVILKLSLVGDLIFWKEFRVNNSDHYVGFPSSFHNYHDTSFILGGSHDVGNESCGLYINFDLNFETINSDTYCSEVENFLFFRHCNIAEDNDIIFTGYERQINQTGNVFLLKTGYAGNEFWRKNFGFETTSEGQKVILTSDNGYIISGYTYTPTNEYSGNALLIKTDSLGNMQWCRTLGHPDYRDGYGSVTLAPDGNFIFGYTHAVYQGPPYPVPEAYCKIKFIKFDQNGDTIWEKMYGSAFQINMLRNIITLHDGSFVAVGYANSDTINGPMQSWIFKINQYGDSIWYRDYRHYESSVLDYLYDIFETSDHGIIACGQSSRAEPGPDGIQRMWILKLDSAGCEEAGCDSTVGIKEGHKGKDALKLGGLVVWPNPASGIVDCRWPIVDFRGDFSLVIYDMFGREMMKISVPENESEIQLDVGNFPQGLYLVVLRNVSNIIGSSKLVISR